MDKSNVNEFNRLELFNMFVGDHIGSGQNRAVFRHAFDDLLVIKIENDQKYFQNIIEWRVWEVVKDTDHAKWFAPCVAISACGSVLIQRRTTPAAVYPDKIPVYLTDCKLANYGILVTDEHASVHGQFVCHDYGVNMLIEKGLSNRMHVANWWNL